MCTTGARLTFGGRLPAALVRAALIASAAALCGCSSTSTVDDQSGKRVHKLGYLRARWLDFSDLMSWGGGLSLGAMGTVTLPWPLDTPLGLGFARAHHYSSADRRYEWREDWHTGLPFSPIWVKKPGGHCIFRGWHCDAILRWLMPTGITTHASKSAKSEIIRSNPPPTEKWRSISQKARVDVAVGAILYVRLGLNFAEILDFIVGWTTIDMAGDDRQVF